MKLELIQLSDELFLKLGNMVTERYGIKMPPEKKIMFQSRLQRRLHELEITSFDDYAKMLLCKDQQAKELSILADYISTNKTEFFRENDHFQFVFDKVLTDHLVEKKIDNTKILKFWSAGCSNGQEAYSIAITNEEYIRQKQVKIEYFVVGTDISSRMLKIAREAIYPISSIEGITKELRHRYFLKSKDQKNQKVRIIKDLRDKIAIAYLNLMDSAYLFPENFDVIFLRNTLIYFSPEIQKKVLIKVLNNLKTGGYLFIGHSESLINLHLPIQSIAPSVYVKINT